MEYAPFWNCTICGYEANHPSITICSVCSARRPSNLTTANLAVHSISTENLNQITRITASLAASSISNPSPNRHAGEDSLSQASSDGSLNTGLKKKQRSNKTTPPNMGLSMRIIPRSSPLRRESSVMPTPSKLRSISPDGMVGSIFRNAVADAVAEANAKANEPSAEDSFVRSLFRNPEEEVQTTTTTSTTSTTVPTADSLSGNIDAQWPPNSTSMETWLCCLTKADLVLVSKLLGNLWNGVNLENSRPLKPNKVKGKPLPTKINVESIFNIYKKSNYDAKIAAVKKVIKKSVAEIRKLANKRRHSWIDCIVVPIENRPGSWVQSNHDDVGKENENEQELRQKVSLGHSLDHICRQLQIKRFKSINNMNINFYSTAEINQMHDLQDSIGVEYKKLADIYEQINPTFDDNCFSYGDLDTEIRQAKGAEGIHLPINQMRAQLAKFNQMYVESPENIALRVEAMQLKNKDETSVTLNFSIHLPGPNSRRRSFFTATISEIEEFIKNQKEFNQLVQNAYDLGIIEVVRRGGRISSIESQSLTQLRSIVQNETALLKNLSERKVNCIEHNKMILERQTSGKDENNSNFQDKINSLDLPSTFGNMV